MPEARLAKTRRSLPEGYQFGDAAGVHVALERLFKAYERVRPIQGDTVRVRIPKRWDIRHDHNCGNMLPEGSSGCDCGAFTTDRDHGDETPTRRLRRREA